MDVQHLLCLLGDLQRRTREAAKALEEAKACGMFGYKVGSEISLPTARHADEDAEDVPGAEHHEITAGYVRRGHMRLQPVGEKRADRKLIFVAPHVVRPDLPLRSTHGYKIRVPKT